MPYPLVAAQPMRPQWNIGNAQRVCEDVSQVDYEGGIHVGDVMRRELQHGQIWDNALHCYLPGTYVTYSWASDDIRAIALSQADVTHQTMLYIRSLQGPLVDVGVVLTGLADQTTAHPRMSAVGWMNDRVHHAAGAPLQTSARVVERGQGDGLVEARVTNSRKRREQPTANSNVVLPRRGELELARQGGPGRLPPPEATVEVIDNQLSKEPHNPMYVRVDESKRPRGNRRRPKGKPKGDDAGPVGSDGADMDDSAQEQSFQEETPTQAMEGAVAGDHQDNFSYYS